MKKISVIYVLFILLLGTEVQANSEVQLSNQNDFEISLENGRLIKVIHDQEVQIIKLQLLDSNNGTQKGEPLLLFIQEVSGFRPKVALIPNKGFALCWIGTQIEQSYLYLQIFSFELNPIIERQEIAAANEDVIWDYVSEFHYLQCLSGTKLLVFYKSSYKHKKWLGLVFDIINPQYIYYEQIQIPYSSILDIIVNYEKHKIDIIQKIDETWQRKITFGPQDQNQVWDMEANIVFCQISSDVNSHKYNCERKCQDGCLTCLTQSVCLICEDGYTLNEQKCVKNQCLSGCQLCNIQQKCIECARGYSFSEDKKDCLAKCPENCLACTLPPICDQCESGTSWSDESHIDCHLVLCFPFEETEYTPLDPYTAFFGSLAIFGILVFIFIIYVKWKERQQARSQNQSPNSFAFDTI